MKPIIRVENLGKRYRIGARKPQYATLRDKVAESLLVPLRSFRGNRARDVETHWALKDVSFNVQPGEVLGIVGRNGAGKSTLLKVLSRITEPTSGVVDLFGRIGSLLEVGTGFHPELTGRENITLNGAILGMRRSEIRLKFDEIVSFAEMDRFIDTPVKYYSSGMYMRLAFSVAAHLEPEVLVIDEVLAVGDAQFQKRCLGKMDEVSKQGRTVLFVSHNLQALKALCTSVIQLRDGRIVAAGKAADILDSYGRSVNALPAERVWSDEEAPGSDGILLTAVRVLQPTRPSVGLFSSNSEVIVEMEFLAGAVHSALCVGFDLISADGTVIARSYQTDGASEGWPMVRPGRNRWRCKIPAGLLNSGVFRISPRISLHNINWIVKLEDAVQFEVALEHGVSPFWNVLDGTNRPGVIAQIWPWISSS